ncbi:preprotein translocase subunit SecA, partial [Corynebacterium kefirresidentii]
MFGLSKLLRAGEGRTVKRLGKMADDVIALEDKYAELSDEELKAKTDEFKTRLKDGEEMNDILLEAFATVREAAWRVLDQKHYRVQIMGGAALHFGNVAEMRTGEGKTLTSLLPAYLNALEGKGVHIVTVNDYLAKRDAEMMGRVHRWLGLSVGVILSEMRPPERKAAYDCDITYGTNNELGFDYLRDNMVRSLNEVVQRGHNFCIVDEVDSILIDEARTPLIISGPVDGSSQFYSVFAQLAPRMREGIHYEVDHKKRTIGVLEEGVEYVEDQLGIDNLYAPEHSQLVSYLNNALKAKELFTRDKDYIVRNGEVMIVDSFTGRVLAGRRYNEGMHQAIEAKEQVEIKNENQTLATVTLQNYFRLYEKISGMTGTAETEAAELHSIYGLDVVPIPTNKPNQRADHSDRIYKTQEAKFAAVVDDIAEHVEAGQPVLVGTTSVERSEYLSQLLSKRGIKHNVLNAKHHEEEGQIIARAGRPGTVTVATNMAGRGTDIVLGGNPEVILDEKLRERGLDPFEDEEKYQEAWEAEIDAEKEHSKKLGDQVREAGGLYVL